MCCNLISLHPQTSRCAPSFSSLNKALVQLQLILKLGVTNAIKNLITMNLRKQLVLKHCITKWDLKNRLAKLWLVFNISEHQLNHCITNVSILGYMTPPELGHMTTRQLPKVTSDKDRYDSNLNTNSNHCTTGGTPNEWTGINWTQTEMFT